MPRRAAGRSCDPPDMPAQTRRGLGESNKRTYKEHVPEEPLTPDKRRIEIDPDTLAPPQRAPFVELGLISCFSFLRGASDAVDLTLTARALGYDAIGIADANTM